MVTFDVDSRDPIQIPLGLRKEVDRYRRQARKIRVMITPVFEERTLSQNALFHAKCKTIERLTGMGYEEVKESVKRLATSMGYPYRRDEHGEPMVSKDGELMPVSTADASISEMKILISALDQWCFENQVEIGEVWQ